jgi:DNA-binding PadR family transcriptional regulator
MKQKHVPSGGGDHILKEERSTRASRAAVKFKRRERASLAMGRFNKRSRKETNSRSEPSIDTIENYVFKEWSKNEEMRVILDFRVLSIMAIIGMLARDGKNASAAEIQVEFERRIKSRVPLATLYVILENLELRELLTSEMTQTKGRPKAIYHVTRLGKDILFETVNYRKSIANKLPKQNSSGQLKSNTMPNKSTKSLLMYS